MASVKLSDLADSLALDISTISRALRHDPRVKKATRDLVQHTARQAGYRPNLIAKNLAEGRSSTIWLLLPDLSTPVEREPSSYASFWLMEKGYDLLIAQYHNSLPVFSRMLDRLDQGRADGAIIVPSSAHLEDPETLPFDSLQVPFVFLDRSIPLVAAPLFSSDNTAIAYRLTLSLVQGASSKNPVRWLANGFFSTRNSAEALREKGLLLAAKNLGLPLVSITDVASGSVPPGRGAIIGTNQFEMEAIANVHQLCPHIAIFDEWRGSKSAFESVLVAIQNFKAMAENAAETLLAAIETGTTPAKESQLFAELEIRMP